MTVAAEESRRDLLERYGRFYGEEHFAVAFTSTIQGEEAKRVTTNGWDTTRPLAGGDHGAGYVGTRGEKRNPAIVLRPSNLIVLECDSEEDLLAIEQLGLLQTLTVRSSKPYKRHFYFRPDDTLEQLPFVAFRFESGKLTADSGRYFLCPPSIHPTGAVYAFLPGLGPDDVDIATMDATTYTELADRAREETAVQRDHLQVDPDAKIRAGNRRDTIFRAACAMRRWTANKQVILASMTAYNQAMCDPPLSAEQVEMQVDGSMKMRGEQDLQRVFDRPPPDNDTPWFPEEAGPFQDEPHPDVEPDRRGDWTPIELADDRYSVPPAPPELLGLVYAATRHILSGPPESAKTLVAYILLLEALREGKSVAVIDFEMGAERARRLLDDLGATLDEIRDIYFVAPDTPPSDGMRTLIERGTWLTLLDAAIGAYDASGLDDNARKDVQKFARTWIDPLWKANVSTLLIDHVGKDKETRGKFTIGSERKLGAADVHLSLEAVQTISRGQSGIVKVHVHKDRSGYLSRPTTAVFTLNSDPTSHRIAWRHTPQEHAQGEEPWRPTILMERLSMYLETRLEPVSFNHAITNTKGKDSTLKEALEHLIALGFIIEEAGPGNTRNVISHLPYRRPLPTSAPPLPAEVSPPLPTSAPPYRGQRVAGAEDEKPASAQAEPVDAETQALIDTYVKPDDDGIPF